MRILVVKFLLAVSLLASICLPSAFAKVHNKQPILDWIPASSRNLIVVNPPYAYEIDNGQPIDPEEKFEFMKIVWILRPPPEESEREFRWIKPSEIAQCAFLDRRKNSSELEYCCVAQLRKDDDRDKELRLEMQKLSSDSTLFDGTIIYKFVYEHCEGLVPEFKAMPAPGVMICASRKEFIEDSLQNNRMNNSINRINSGWKNVSSTSSYWGFRTFNDAEKAELEDSDAVGYNFAYSKKTLDFNFEYITAGTYDKNQKLKLILEDGASKFSKSRQSACRLNFFSWTYPATKPDHWSGRIQPRVMMVAHDFNEVFEFLRKVECLQKQRQAKNLPSRHSGLRH